MAASIRSTGYKGRLPRALAGLPPLPLDRVPGPWMRLPSRFDRDAAGLQPHAQCAAIRGALDPRPGLPPACHHVRLRVAEAVAMARRANGRASCRGRVCPYVYISVVAVSFNKKTTRMYYESD